MEDETVRHSDCAEDGQGSFYLLPISDGVSKVWVGICERRGLNMGRCAAAAHLWRSAQAGSSSGRHSRLSRTPRGVHISSGQGSGSRSQKSAS